MTKSTLKLSGRIRCQVVDQFDRIIADHGWQKNLLLDQGMDAIAEVLICDLWKYCAAGTDATATQRALAGNVSQTGTTVTNSVAEFSAADVGRMLKVGVNERRLFSFTNTTHMEVVETGNFGATGGGKIYNVEQTKLFAEAARTNTYGNSSGDNSTTTVTQVRTFKRTFLFPAEPAAIGYKEVGFSHLTSKPVGNIDDIIVGVNLFTITTEEDHGLSSGVDVILAGITGNTPDINGQRTITVTAPNEFTVPSVGATTAGTGGTYQPVDVQPNINIRVKLAATVNVALNQRLKVIYEFELTVEPDTEQSGASNITGGAGAQFSNPNAKWAIEKFNTSIVNLDGSTDDSGVELEPAHAGVMAMSDNSDAITPLAPVTRNTNVEIVDLTAETYVPGSYELEYEGMFDLEDGNSAAIRSLMIYDEDSSHGVFTMRFDNPQTKNSDHSLTIVWKKSWSRELN